MFNLFKFIVKEFKDFLFIGFSMVILINLVGIKIFFILFKLVENNNLGFDFFCMVFLGLGCKIILLFIVIVKYFFFFCVKEKLFLLLLFILIIL